MTELTRDRLELAAGGNYMDTILELWDAIRNSPSLMEMYYEIRSDVEIDDEDDEVVIEELVARLCGAPFQIINDEVVYRNGIFTHDEVMRMLNA